MGLHKRHGEGQEKISNILRKRSLSALFKVNNLMLASKDSKIKCSSNITSNYHLKLKSAQGGCKYQIKQLLPLYLLISS